MIRAKAANSRALRGVAVLVGILTACWPGGASAQPASEYRLGPGDVVSVSVWGHPDMTTDVQIRPDGKLTLPLVGTVPAAGLTVRDVVAELTRAYGEYVVDPQVAVLIKQYRKLSVSVLGQVLHPGIYDLPPGARALDAIAAAGGLTEAAATRGIPLMGPGEAVRALDLAQALKGDGAANVALNGGETIVVPEDLADVVNVAGQVVRPGQLRLKGPMRVLDALLQAGGLTGRASLTQAVLVRASGEREPLALGDLVLHQDMSANVALAPGDTIFVPEETNDKIYVLGDVRNPGAFQVQTDLSLLQALALAGGPEQRGAATARTIYVLRRTGTPQEIHAGPAVLQSQALPNGGTLFSANLQALMKDPASGVPVQPGDVIVVPQSHLGGLQWIVNVLAGLASVFYNVRTVP